VLPLPTNGYLIVVVSVVSIAIDYSGSKAAAINIVQTAASELYGRNIRVNALCPGLVETGMTAPVFDNARARGTTGKIGQLNPLRRPGYSNEIASAALFLASDDSSYVNGQALPIDGGLSASLPIVQLPSPQRIEANKRAAAAKKAAAAATATKK
jgi:NAD(P)-dependent dehydrogenase (short-subunit alcohol dehydrogenase family)